MESVLPGNKYRPRAYKFFIGTYGVKEAFNFVKVAERYRDPLRTPIYFNKMGPTEAKRSKKEMLVIRIMEV